MGRMDSQFLGRQQRPKGANIKQALRVMLLLAVCAWLVHQINHSRNKTENYGGQPKLDEEYGVISLGRKGTPSRFDVRDIPNSGNVHFVEARKTNRGRDDLSDGAMEDQTEEKIGHIDEKELENQSKKSPKNKFKDTSKKNSGKVQERSTRSESDHKGQGNKEYSKTPVINDEEPELQIREPPNDVQNRKNTKSGGSVKENEEVEDPKISEKQAMMQENVVDSATNIGENERIGGVHSFHDENGVPPEVNETEPIGSDVHNPHKENKSNNNKESRKRRSNTYEVTSASAEDSNVELTLEGSTRDVIADPEINSQIRTTHVDTSGINHNSETSEGDSLVL